MGEPTPDSGVGSSYSLWYSGESSAAAVFIIKKISDLWPQIRLEENQEMISLLRRMIRISTACFLVAVFALPSNLLAETHVVTPAELHAQALVISQARQRNVATLQHFLSSASAQEALSKAHVDAGKVMSAMSSLSDEELAQLASKATKAQADFAAGTMSDRDLLLILVAIAALILIIVAVR
jgi:hypothetical protein